MIDIKDKDNMSKYNPENLFKQNYGGRTSRGQAEQFFLKIYKLSGLKELVYLSLNSEKQTSTLLVGCPDSAKSMFISIIQAQCNDVFYFDALNTPGSNLLDELHENKEAKVVIIDNMDKLSKNQLNSLRGFLDNGRIVKILKTKQMDFKIDNVKVFATASNKEKLGPVSSRIELYHVPRYSDNDYVYAIKHYFLNKLFIEISDMIATELLAHDIKDMKAAISIGDLLNNECSQDDIDKVIGDYIKDYKRISRN